MINIANYKVEQDSRLPKLYKRAAVIAQTVVDEGGSLKDLVFSSEEKLIKPVYALVVETIKNLEVLDKIVKKSKLFKKSSSLQLWLSRILLTELLFRKKKLLGGSSWPVKYIREHQEKLENLLSNYSNPERKVQKPRYVRVNTLKLTPDEAIKIFRNEGWILIPLPSDYSKFLEVVSNLQPDEFVRDFHIKELLVFPKNTQFFNHELYSNGSILLQDKASCLATYLLNPEKRSIVWDMCAAPGMKTTHLSAIMKNKGEIYATELHTKRYNDLCQRVESAGCKNVKPFNFDAFLVSPYSDDEAVSWCNDIEYILLDPSCSGSGMTDRLEIYLNEKIDEDRLSKLCQFQFKLLTHALSNFPKVKRIVYSTCSLKPEENEMVVRDVLKNLSEPKDLQKTKKHKKNKRKHESQLKFKLVKPLEDTWPRRGSDEYEFGPCCLNSDPEKDLTNGFFIAVFERIVEDVSENDNQIEEHVEKKKKKKKKNKEKFES